MNTAADIDPRDELEPGAPEAGHEPLTVSIRGIVLTVIGVVALVAVAVWVMRPLSILMAPRFAGDEADPYSDASENVPQDTVGLNPDQRSDRDALEQRQREWLSEYAWLDEKQQVARIPIDRALEIIEQRGLTTTTKQTKVPTDFDNRQSNINETER